MTTFKKFLPWMLLVVAVGVAVWYIDKYSKAKAANKSLVDGAVAAIPGNTGIAGGLNLDM